MVVVRSRKHCVLFHEEMVNQMRKRGLSYSCLVGFSGTIFHNGRENTENTLNGENGLEKRVFQTVSKTLVTESSLSPTSSKRALMSLCSSRCTWTRN